MLSSHASASRTRILAINAGTKQTTVFSNHIKVETGKTAVMVLPVPVRDFKVVAVSSDLFSRVEQTFHPGVDQESVSVSTYQYKKASRLSDLVGLGYEIPADLQQFLSRHYSTRYSFLVCQVEGDKQYAPIAYQHDMVDNALFLPTNMFTGDAVPEWDHTVYIYNCDTNDVPGEESAPIDLQVALHDAQLPRLIKKRFKKIQIQGRYKRRDLRYNLPKQPSLLQRLFAK